MKHSLQACLFVLFFFTIKAEASREIIYEVSKPGVPANFLIGSTHDVLFDEDSLPSEVRAAMETAVAGLFEVALDDLPTPEREIHILNKTSRRRAGDTLSLHIGEERARELFSAVQTFLSENQGASYVVGAFMKSYFSFDITSYEDFNRLKSKNILYITDKLFQLRGEKGEWAAKQLEQQNGNFDLETVRKPYRQKTREAPETANCFHRNRTMDDYFKETLACLGKPAFSLESLEEREIKRSDIEERQALQDLKYNLDGIISRLSDGRVDASARFESKVRSIIKIIRKMEEEIIMSELRVREKSAVRPFVKAVFVRTFSRKLKDAGCAYVPEHTVRRLTEADLEALEIRIDSFLSGLQITDAAGKVYEELMRSALSAEYEILRLCFPDYIPPENLEKRIEKEAQLKLNNLKVNIESLLLSRDPGMARVMAVHFEKGGVIAVAGAFHLAGLIRELEAQGWNVKALETSGFKRASRKTTPD